MAIDWQGKQDDVEHILTQHPPESSECANAARQILPVAKEIDGDAKPWHITPRRARYLGEKAGLGWHYHVNVEVTDHYVDALTGAEGHEKSSYLETYFEYPDQLNIELADLTSTEL